MVKNLLILALLSNHKRLAMKKVSKTRKIADKAAVRTGDMSPAFPKKIADSGKVRMGDMSPCF